MINWENIAALLLEFGADPRIRNLKGETAIGFACLHQNLRICQMLQAARVDVNNRDHLGRTPLFISVKANKDTDLVKFLIQSGADPNISDNELNSPLHVAAERGLKEFALMLLSAGADPYELNSSHQLPYELVPKDTLK